MHKIKRDHIFCGKSVRNFCSAKVPHIFFHKKMVAVLHIIHVVQNFNVSLTNEIVSFEQPGPGVQVHCHVFLPLF